jgi:hypothetical protein
MLKLLMLAATLLFAGYGAVSPVYAAANNEIPDGPGCTMNPFDHTWRCIDFANCKKAPDGTYTDCPVTTGTYLQRGLRGANDNRAKPVGRLHLL